MLFGVVPAKGENLIFFDEGGVDALYNFDTVTNAVTLRTAVSVNRRYFGMDVRPSDKKVFAIEYNTDSLASALWTIDINTGLALSVGPTANNMCGLAFQPGSDALFGITHGGQLYSVNASSGTSTLIGNSNPVIRGISFNSAGTLYGFGIFGALYQVNPATGAATAIGGTGNPVPGNDIAEDSTFTPSGQLFGTDFGGDLFKTDPITGNGTKIAVTGQGAGLLALIAEPTPEPAIAGLIIGFFTLTARIRSRERIES
jgi:hypothetical protein